MASKLDEALGIHPQMLDFRVERTKILAGNLANAETPGYKAQDLNFQSLMAQMNTGIQVNGQYEIGYRIPFETSADQNTVELSKEKAKYAQNAMDYQTSLTFLNMKISGLKSAIEGR